MSRSVAHLILRWHRWLGLATVPFVVVLAITGVLLERTDVLELDKNYVANEWLLAWYGVAPPGDPISYQAGDQWISWLAGTLYLDGRPVERAAPVLTGAVSLGPSIVVSTSEAIYLFTSDGELVEKVSPIGIEGTIDAIAVRASNELLIHADSGIFASDIDMIAWRPVANSTVSWPGRRPSPDAIRLSMLENYRGVGLPWERVMLDLHSGRLMGSFGPYLMDFAALMLMLLSATGLYNWARRR